MTLIESLESRTLFASLTITAGGTYTGAYDSYDYAVPVITVKTSQAVTIRDATLKGKYHAIYVPYGYYPKLTILNVKGVGVYPGGTDRYPGRFVSAQSFGSIHIEGSYLEQTSGIYLLNPAAGATVKVLRNEAVNIDGRYTNGAGGFKDTYKRVQFVQLNQCNVPGAEIAWNRITNQLGKSRVEDVVSFYKSAGSSSNRMKAHHNLIDGAYPLRASMSYSGGGIIVEDSDYVDIFSNTIIQTTNYGAAIAGGHDNRIYANRVFSSGKVNGTALAANNVGIYIWDYEDRGAAFYNNYAYDNLSGWWSTKQQRRNDYWLPDDDESKSHDNAKSFGTVTASVEQAERDRWIAAAGAAS